MSSFKWHCPYCGHDTTIIEGTNVKKDYTWFQIENKDWYRYFTNRFIVCPNPECNKFTLEAHLYEVKIIWGEFKKTSELKRWNLIPQSNAKVFPGYIPKAIIEDYNEACTIKDLSPKASATLSRRCLQWIIRDYWSVNDSTLAKEIEKIKERIDPLILQSIDAVRKIWNIWAHMEKEIDLIIDVIPEEADKLIWLIELLIKEWYINRFEKQKSLNEIIWISKEKQDKKQNK